MGDELDLSLLAVNTDVRFVSAVRLVLPLGLQGHDQSAIGVANDVHRGSPRLRSCSTRRQSWASFSISVMPSCRHSTNTSGSGTAAGSVLIPM